MTRKTKLNIVLWVFSFILLLLLAMVSFVFVAMWSLHPVIALATAVFAMAAIIRYYLAESALEFIYWKL